MNIENEMDKTLSAWDEIPRATANPYMYEKIQLRLNTIDNKGSITLKVGFIKPALVFILLITTVINFYVGRENTTQASNKSTETAKTISTNGLSALADEYGFTENHYINK
jgi:hypothetical protein